MQSDLAKREYLERLLLLKTFPGLGSVNEGALSVMAERSRLVEFPLGKELYSEGGSVQHLYFIIEGEVVVRRQGVVVHRVGRKGTLGALSTFARSLDAPQAIVERQTVALELEARDTEEIFTDNFDMIWLALVGVAFESIETRKRAGPSAGFSPEFCPVFPPASRLGLAQKIEFLSSSALFSGTRFDKLALVARESIERRYREGEVLWETGELSAKFLICLDGAIECERPLQRFSFSVGDDVGLLESLAGCPRWYTARASAAVIALELDANLLLDIFEDDPKTAMRLLSRFSQDLISIRKTFADVVYVR